MEINADNLRMVNGQIKPINGMTEKLVSIFNSLKPYILNITYEYISNTSNINNIDNLL